MQGKMGGFFQNIYKKKIIPTYPIFQLGSGKQIYFALPFFEKFCNK
jgi:hypothetical protein